MEIRKKPPRRRRSPTVTDPPGTYPRRYVGKTMPGWYGRRCRITATWKGRALHNVGIMFENGERTICPIRCTRKIKDERTVTP